jgi:hypothetical protein
LALGRCLLLRVLLVNDLARVIDVVVLEALSLQVLGAALAWLIEVERVRISVTLVVLRSLLVVRLALFILVSLGRLVLTDL